MFRNSNMHPDMKQIKDMLEKDTNFMKRCEFLDYSVLLAIEKTKPFLHQKSFGEQLGYHKQHTTSQILSQV